MSRARQRCLAILAGLGSWLMLAAPGQADEPVRHQITLKLDPAAGRLEGIDEVTVVGRTHVALRPAAGLELQDVKLDGVPVRAAMGEAGWQVQLPDQQRHQVAFQFRGRLAASGDGPAEPPILTAEGGFLPYGEGWLAAADEAWVTYRLRLETPKGQVAIATGRLVSETEDALRRVVEFEASEPTEPPSVFVGPYRISERMSDGVALRSYFYADQADLAEAYLEQAAQYLHRFQAEIGAYPYPSFAMIAAPLPVGMGFPGLTYFSRQILPMPFMRTRSLAHEILHNWWGNGVFIDARRGNWAEGLTTYLADHALAVDDSAEAARELRLGWLRDYAALPPARDQPAATFVAKGHAADQVVGYNKTAMLFHMLALRLGPERFQAGLRDFWQRYRFTAASWTELQGSFETVSGQDLDRFFEQWLQRPGAPKVTLDQAELQPSGDGYRLRLGLRQAKPTYALQVPVVIRTGGAPIEQVIELTGEQASAELTLEAKPTAVEVDQSYDLFRRLLPGETPPILRDVTFSDQAQLVLATGSDPGAAEIAAALGGRLLEQAKPVPLGEPTLDRAPVLAIGLETTLAPVFERLKLPGVPEPLAGRGTARVWTAPRQAAPPVLVVAAADAEALAALMRPLPHYGRVSYLVFDGAKAVDQGVWPGGPSALVRALP